MANRKESRAQPESPSAYDSLIDAERDALIQAGRKPTRGELIRALGTATTLTPRAARRAVDRFIDRRGGFIPIGTAAEDARTGWIDGLLDAERVLAARNDRTLTRRTMIRAVRQASPSLSDREARAAVADYLHRRGGQTPRAGRGRILTLGAIGFIIIALSALVVLLRSTGS